MKKVFFVLLLLTGITAFVHAQDTTKAKRTHQERAQLMTMMMQNKLNLTADQTKKVNEILTNEMVKISDPKAGKMVKFRAMKDSDAKMQAVLTPDQQKTYVMMKQNMKDRMAEMRKEKMDAGPQ